MVELPFVVANSSGDRFAGDLRYMESGNPKPVVIICHGFTAHKDWGPFPRIGQAFAAQGFASIVFNFSHNGIGNDFKRFTELEKFSRNTIGKELEDLRCILDVVERGEVGEGIIDRNRVGLVGHSRGAGVAILQASRDVRVKAVAAWSTISTFHRYTEHQKELWQKNGYHPVRIRSMNTRLRYGIDVLEDLEKNKQQYDLLSAVRRLHVPLMLVHGEADVSVKPLEAKTLYEQSDKAKTELVLVPHAGHMFGVRSGATKKTPELEHITELTAKWFHLHI